MIIYMSVYIIRSSSWGAGRRRVIEILYRRMIYFLFLLIIKIHVYKASKADRRHVKTVETLVELHG